MKRSKRIFSLALALLLALSLLPGAALAAGSSLEEALNVAGGNLHFSTSGNYPWVVTTVNGAPCAQSGNGGVNDSDSDLTLSLNVGQASILSFEYYVSVEQEGEALYDRGELYLDDAEITEFQTAETAGWQTYLLTLQPGEHTVTWCYRKDGSQSWGDDVFMLRNVRLVGSTAISITQQPVDYVGAEGSTATFTVAAQGDGLTYQWWIRNPGKNDFTKSTRRTATYSTTLKAASSGRELYCVVTDSHGNSVTTNVVTMSIATLAILQQPVNYVGAEGSTATFTVVAEGEGPLSYQWWIRNPGENDFTKSTRRTATYSTTLRAASSGRELYCVVTDRYGNSITTSTVTMSIATLTILQQPLDYVGAEGSTAAFTVAAQGDGLSYQWWIRNPGENAFSKSTRRTATYSTTLRAASDGRELYCVVTDRYGNSVTTDTVTMSIATLTITRQPLNYVGAEGSTAAFTVVAQGQGTLTYQWWIRNPGENAFSKSTRRTATYSTTLRAASDGRELYCVVTDRYGNSVTTDTVTMSIATLTITRQPLNYVGAEGSTASFTVVAQGQGTLTYQWWIRNPGETEFTKSTRKTATYSTTLRAASDGRELYCVVTDSYGNSVTTDTVTMSIAHLATVIDRQPENFTGSIGDVFSFTVAASGEGLSYRWQYRSGEGAAWNDADLDGSNTATLSGVITEARLACQYRCKITDARGEVLYTASVLLIEATAQPDVPVGPDDPVGPDVPVGPDEPSVGNLLFLVDNVSDGSQLVNGNLIPCYYAYIGSERVMILTETAPADVGFFSYSVDEDGLYTLLRYPRQRVVSAGKNQEAQVKNDRLYGEHSDGVDIANIQILLVGDAVGNSHDSHRSISLDRLEELISEGYVLILKYAYEIDEQNGIQDEIPVGVMFVTSITPPTGNS